MELWCLLVVNIGTGACGVWCVVRFIALLMCDISLSLIWRCCFLPYYLIPRNGRKMSETMNLLCGMLGSEVSGELQCIASWPCIYTVYKYFPWSTPLPTCS